MCLSLVLKSIRARAQNGHDSNMCLFHPLEGRGFIYGTKDGKVEAGPALSPTHHACAVTGANEQARSARASPHGCRIITPRVSWRAKPSDAAPSLVSGEPGLQNSVVVNRRCVC